MDGIQPRRGHLLGRTRKACKVETSTTKKYHRLVLVYVYHVYIYINPPSSLPRGQFILFSSPHPKTTPSPAAARRHSRPAPPVPPRSPAPARARASGTSCAACTAPRRGACCARVVAWSVVGCTRASRKGDYWKRWGVQESNELREEWRKKS
jgi:hypothetical protein